MIQRVQSIYWLVAIILFILFIFVPYGTSGTQTVETDDSAITIGLSVFIGLITLANIFLFKNRILQINISRVTMLLIMALIGVCAYFLVSIQGQDMPQYGAILPILGWLLNFLGMRGVIADEKLVRSVDRLR